MIYLYQKNELQQETYVLEKRFQVCKIKKHKNSQA